jgi:hypothetical protein
MTKIKYTLFFIAAIITAVVSYYLAVVVLLVGVSYALATAVVLGKRGVDATKKIFT